MDPYYLTALVNMLVPIKRVSGMTKRACEQRMIGSEPLQGQRIDVEVDTHVSALLDFHNGVIGTLIMSFDVWAHNLPNIQVHGTAESLQVPDPNHFAGTLKMVSLTESKVAGADVNFGTWDQTGWEDQEHLHINGSRGAGACDMAIAIKHGRAHRASGDLALHVLEAMEAIVESGTNGTFIDLQSKPERPEAVPAQLVHAYS